MQKAGVCLYVITIAKVAWATIHNGHMQRATSLPIFYSIQIWISSTVYKGEVRMKTMPKNVPAN